jgi:hypothetical protein
MKRNRYDSYCYSAIKNILEKNECLAILAKFPTFSHFVAPAVERKQLGW